MKASAGRPNVYQQQKKLREHVELIPTQQFPSETPPPGPPPQKTTDGHATGSPPNHLAFPDQPKSLGQDQRGQTQQTHREGMAGHPDTQKTTRKGNPPYPPRGQNNTLATPVNIKSRQTSTCTNVQNWAPRIRCTCTRLRSHRSAIFFCETPSEASLRIVWSLPARSWARASMSTRRAS